MAFLRVKLRKCTARRYKDLIEGIQNCKMDKLEKNKKEYYQVIDSEAKNLARDLAEKRTVTDSILLYTHKLYQAAKSERSYKDEDTFDTAYHAPITSDFEFFIARILLHYSKLRNKNWKIYLRRQMKGTAVDVRIEKNGKTVAVIEIKVKAGWIQPVFSKSAEKRVGEASKEGIEKFRTQIDKYKDAFGINRKDVFILLPTFIHVHRVRGPEGIHDYKKAFVKNSGLPEENLLLLSENPTLDLSTSASQEELRPTNQFEKFIWSL